MSRMAQEPSPLTVNTKNMFFVVAFQPFAAWAFAISALMSWSVTQLVPVFGSVQ